jgi:hypothetical protein
LQRADGLSWRTDLFAVRDQIPLDYPYPSQIKRALEKAHAELEEKGFLSEVEYEELEEGNTTSVLYRISPLFARRQKALELSGTPQERVRNRASFLVSAIRKGYALPGPPEQHQEPLEPSFESSVIAHDAQRETEQHPPEDPEGFPPPTPDAAADEIWTRALENAEGEIDASSLRVWFGSVTAVALGSESLTISVPTPFARECIETRFKVALEAALREELSEGAALRVIIHTFRGARIACKLWGLSELPTGRGKPSEGLTGPREGIVVSDRCPGSPGSADPSYARSFRQGR